ncbi:kinase-like domain-containing protein [Cubamyces menziesii]|nr:kinase-like domain-containing protein [Cubamyces menziesii]
MSSRTKPASPRRAETSGGVADARAHVAQLSHAVSSPNLHAPPFAPLATPAEPHPCGVGLSSRARRRDHAVDPARNVLMKKHSSHRLHPMTCGERTEWWTRIDRFPRPWQDRWYHTVPEEQTAGWMRTRQRVAEASVKVLGATGKVVHELLGVGVDFLRFAPIPALEEAARTLLNIWDSLQLVDVNRLACLRLTERCAGVLISVREEVAEAGNHVGVELHRPIARLVESFHEVHSFLVKQAHRPFLKRYLQRDEIQRSLADCHHQLNDAMSMFSLSIQIRILKQALRASGHRSQINHHRSQLDRLSVLSDLLSLTTRENAHDRARDAADLRQLLCTALKTHDDAEFIRVLQVGRDEMPEAIKTLQRALELGDHRARSLAQPRDALDREFMEAGIGALCRLSGFSDTVRLPSWTITKYEVEREEKIGLGFWSDVYKGKWAGRTVAIKVLAQTTPRKLFIHEMSIWTKLQHPNVLELLGASSASGDPPWFFVSPYYKNGSLVTYLKGLPTLETADVLKIILEIAQGMEYLHCRGVLHGDLKAANVLVDDMENCVIADFGQSEMKSEACRISGLPLSRGTLRWQAPEVMSGQSRPTAQSDVYAFAITCYEVLSKGALPWSMADDGSVRYFVLQENKRPQLPANFASTWPWAPRFTEILNACWHREPAVRPLFAQIAYDVQQISAPPPGAYVDVDSGRINDGRDSLPVGAPPRMAGWALPKADAAALAGAFGQMQVGYAGARPSVW